MTARVVFLGGVGEIGRNMLAVETQGRILVIDCGLSFPNDEMLGVDLVLPDFSYVAERAGDCEAVVLTHGHEDHVGALPWFLRRVDVPVYGTPLTLGIARRRIAEAGIEPKMVEVSAPGRKQIGPFGCRFLATSHSIPDSIAVAIDVPEGRVLYTSDFKLDATPIDDRVTDLPGLSELGNEGVDLLLSDSTNAEHPGRTESERIVGQKLREIFAAAPGRIIVACFASNLHRMQQVFELAEAMGRRVAIVGRSMVSNLEVGRELGYLRVDSSTLLDAEELDREPRPRTLVMCTGVQGEPLSALSLIAAGEHKTVRVEPGDTVILSASAIPGNEAAVHRVINALYKAGADVYHSETSDVHVSGHAAADELEEMIRTVRPRHFIPVHGEYRHLALHARIGQRAGLPRDRITMVEDGDVIELDGGSVRKAGRVPTGMTLVDGLGVGDVGPVVLRDRRVLADDGILICVLTIDGQTGEVIAGPDLISRGFVYEDQSRDLLDEAARRVDAALEPLEEEGVTEWAAIKKACRRALGQYIWETTQRRPMIMPIVMEV